MTRRLLNAVAGAAALAAVAALCGSTSAQEAPKSVKIGYAIARTGP